LMSVAGKIDVSQVSLQASIRLRAIAATMVTATACHAPSPPPKLIVWAWERPEDLRFLPADTEIAALTGSVELSVDRVIAHGRRFPLLIGRAPVTTAVVHIEIDGRPLHWTPALADAAVAAVLAYGLRPGIAQLQVDFEVPASQRRVVLDVLHIVRSRLPRSMRLSMTAIASWCDGERWLAAAPVDEVVPMLFRMGAGGPALLTRLGGRTAFANPRCRDALGIASDTPIADAPRVERVYLFSPRSWTFGRFAATRREVARWGG